jgi:type I restriction enzyme S subunit
MSSKSKNLRAFVASCETKTEETTPALVPKLRFPGFSGPWAHEPLSKVLKEHKLKNTAGRDVFSVSMEYGIVNQIELLGRSYAAADPSHYTIGRRFDVVYTKSPLKAFPFGVVKQCKFDGEVALSPLYGVFTPHNPHLGLMVEAYFESPNRSKDFLSPLCQKGAKNTLQITNTTFLSGRLPLPTQPAEQQKIASCLSSVDELIAAQARKVDALKTHKKGLMQQLFPREGETQPRLRFPEFQNAGEWAKMTLGQAATFYNGRAYKQEELLDSGKFPVLRVGNFFTNKNWYYSDLELDETKYCDDGDLLYAWSASFGPRVWHGGKVIYHYHIWKVEERRGIDRQFLFITLENETDRMKAQSANGLGLLHITKGTIEGWESSFPPQPAEQQRIASCLTSLDDLIAAQTQKLEALKTHKKGLMQQLFPSPEEQNTL